MLITKAINFLLEREQLSNCLPRHWQHSQFSGSRYFSKKKFFFCRKSAALFPHLQQAQALNRKIENDFLTLLVENYCQGMGRRCPLSRLLIGQSLQIPDSHWLGSSQFTPGVMHLFSATESFVQHQLIPGVKTR